MSLWSELKTKFNLETVNFNPDSDFRTIKDNTIRNWINDPCGSNYSEENKLTKEFFSQVEKHRYFIQPWNLEDINSFDLDGKKVLEIGFGMGTDHILLARRNAILHGIDMGSTNHSYTKKRFQLFDLKTSLVMGDAESLPFQESAYDFVYSFGVAHHSPDTQKIINETYRVLKPGGKSYFTVYNKNSLLFWWSVFFAHFLVAGGWNKRTLQRQLSLIEYPNTNENILVKLYQKDDFADLFKKYSKVETHIRHLTPDDLEGIRRFFRNPAKPRAFFTWLGKKFGWYIVVKAVK